VFNCVYDKLLRQNLRHRIPNPFVGQKTPVGHYVTLNEGHMVVHVVTLCRTILTIVVLQ